MPESLYIIEASKIVESIIVDDITNLIIKTGPSLKKFENKSFSILKTWLNKITQGKYKAMKQENLAYGYSEMPKMQSTAGN